MAKKPKPRRRRRGPKRALPARRRPKSALERSENWAGMPDDGSRKRRCAEALRDDDVDALAGLLASYVLTFGRRRARTSPNTLDSYRHGLKALMAFAPVIARKVHQMTPLDAQRYVDHLQAAGRADATINSRLAAARVFIRAVRWCGMIEADPFEGVGVTDPTPVEAKIDPYTRAELARLLKKATAREVAMTLLGADGGLRVSEVADLQWPDVDLGRASVRVRGKGGKVQPVGLTGRLVRSLRAVRGRRKAVFAIKRRRVQAIFERLCRRARVRHRGFHALRHSCGTRMYEQKKDQVAVKRHLRHSRLETSGIYIHLADDDYRAAVAGLEKS